MEKEIKIKDKTYFFVEVLDDVKSYEIDEGFLYCYDIEGKLSFALQAKLLGFYKIISTTKDITEKQAENIIESKIYSKNIITYKDYMFLHSSSDYEKELLFDYMTAKESLQSLIRANGLDVEKNYLILLKN